jgi:hypothetical protein
MHCLSSRRWFMLCLACIPYLVFVPPEIVTSYIDWARLSRFLPEDGDRIQSPKLYFKIQTGKWIVSTTIIFILVPIYYHNNVSVIPVENSNGKFHHLLYRENHLLSLLLTSSPTCYRMIHRGRNIMPFHTNKPSINSKTVSVICLYTHDV